MKAKIFVDKNIKIGSVNKHLFGSFIEHLGRAVYTGIYEPGHPTADANGFRTDVIEMIRGLNVPIVRYPGGNYLSGYNWEDGIGPKAHRPTRLDLAWQTIEDNHFGTDEFIDWCRVAGVEPMLGVNLGTGTPEKAGNLVEYCNFSHGTYYSNLRIKNGHPESYNVKYWCLGNEMDGPWQICHLNAEDYAKKAVETAKIMRWIDPSIRLIACGSSGPEMPTYPEWDRIVLEELYDQIDYISMHRYYWDNGDLLDFFASYKDMNDFIQTIKATIDYAKAKKRSRKTVKISFDEWNVWYQNQQTPAGWVKAPHILEDIYSLKDALVFGGLMNTLLNNCDRVEIACLAQLVNVIAPIFTAEGGKAFKQTIYYPFEAVSNYGRGIVLQTTTDSPTFNSKYGETKYLSDAIVYNEENQEISIFLVNYADKDLDLTVELRSFGKIEAVEHLLLQSKDLLDKNTLDKPDNVLPEQAELPRVDNGRLSVKLVPHSYHMIRCRYIPQ
ncbi:MAG: alpha-N-arabinofuranosidase [Acholeplasmataceae bacterium]|nr:alpha-N-arabinofuranosidase [Acholeplasmataceae bacterium]